MENNMEMSQEELEQMIEKLKREVQERLDKMTPEEREQAELKAQKMIEEDQAHMKQLLDDAAKYAADPSPKKTPNFCGNCGAPAGDGIFCAYCGSPLQNNK